MARFIIALVCLGLSFGSFGEVSAADILKLGVLAKRGPAVAQKKWGPLTAYLSSKTGKKVVLIPLSFVAIEPAVKTGKIDFLLANPGFYVALEKQYGIKAIASMLNSRQGKALDRFGGVIFVKKGSAIKDVSQIKGKKFMCVKKTSFGGGQMAFRLLSEKGINPFKDTVLLEGRKHDNVVMAVAAGSVDVGTVRSDTLERMESEGKIKVSDFVVLEKKDDDFPFVHSTRLYPEWPFAVLKHVPAATAQQVADALFSLQPDDPAAKAAKIAGWVKPLDYSPVSECLDIVNSLAK